MFNPIYDVTKGNYYSLPKNSKCESNLMFISSPQDERFLFDDSRISQQDNYCKRWLKNLI